MISLIICSYPKVIMRVSEHTFDFHIRHLKWESLLILMINDILMDIVAEKAMLFSIDQDLIAIAIHGRHLSLSEHPMLSQSIRRSQEFTLLKIICIHFTGACHP